MKYLELVKGQFTADHEARAKQEEPYVAYSEEAGGVMYTFIPEPYFGPANNEIWYTSSDGNVVTPYSTSAFDANIVSNTYEDEHGVITFDGPVMNIGDMAFYHCDAITSFTIPNSVTSIGEYAFSFCPFSSIEIPNRVTSIAKYAFAECYSLTSITIPNSVTSIENGTFDACFSLTSITIPNSVTSIGDSVFARCSTLNSIDFQGTIEQWTAISKGNNWDIKVPVTTVVHCTDGDISLVDPSSTKIWYTTKDGSVVNLYDYYFTVSVVSNTYENGQGVITFNGSVKSIAKYAFDDCSSLTSVTIPNNVKSIEDNAFSNCSSLASIEFQGTMEQWNAINKGSNWNSNVPVTEVQCSDGQVEL